MSKLVNFLKSEDPKNISHNKNNAQEEVVILMNNNNKNNNTNDNQNIENSTKIYSYDYIVNSIIANKKCKNTEKYLKFILKFLAVVFIIAFIIGFCLSIHILFSDDEELWKYEFENEMEFINFKSRIERLESKLELVSNQLNMLNSLEQNIEINKN